MMTINNLNESIIKKQDELIEALEASNKMRDKYIAALETARKEEQELHKAEMAETTKLYSGAVAFVAAERDEAITLTDELKKDVQHWKAQLEYEHNAFEQADKERGQALRNKEYLQRCNQALHKEIESYKQDVQHWQAQAEREHNAFEQAAADRDQALKDKAELRRRLHTTKVELTEAEDKVEKLSDEGAQLFLDHTKALEFIDSIAEMIACDCELSDIAEEFVAWRKGEWSPTESIEDFVGQIVDEDDDSFFGGNVAEPDDDPYRWAVYVVEEKGGERVFTGFFADYDEARESVDLMTARGCYEAWVEDKA